MYLSIIQTRCSSGSNAQYIRIPSLSVYKTTVELVKPFTVSTQSFYAFIYELHIAIKQCFRRFDGPNEVHHRTRLFSVGCFPLMPTCADKGIFPAGRLENGLLLRYLPESQLIVQHECKYDGSEYHGVDAE